MVVGRLGPMTPEQLKKVGVLGAASGDIFLYAVWETPEEALHCLTKRLEKLHQIHKLTLVSTLKSRAIPRGAGKLGSSFPVGHRCAVAHPSSAPISLARGAEMMGDSLGPPSSQDADRSEQCLLFWLKGGSLAGQEAGSRRHGPGQKDACRWEAPCLLDGTCWHALPSSRRRGGGHSKHTFTGFL